MQENKIKVFRIILKLKADEIKMSKTLISEIPVTIFHSTACYISISSDCEDIKIPEDKDIPTHKSRIFVDGSEKEKEKNGVYKVSE